jgi:two-component system, NarL family, sensor kinase
MQAQERQQYEGVTGFEQRRDTALLKLKNFPKPDTARVNALIELFNTAVFLKQRQEVTPYRLEALTLSRKLHYTSGLAHCYVATGAFYKSASDYDRAHLYFDSAIIMAGSSNQKELLQIKAGASRQKGAIYFQQENFYMALDCYFEALKTADSVNTERTPTVYGNIIKIYTALNNYAKATEYAEKNLALVEASGKYEDKEFAYFSYIGLCIAKKDFRTASLYLDKIAPHVPDSIQVQSTFGYYQKRGEVSYYEKQHETAYRYFRQAWPYAMKGGHLVSKSACLKFLSATALQLNQPDSAREYALQNLAIADEMKSTTPKIDALINLSNYYNAVGNKAKAYELSRDALALKDSIAVEQNQRQTYVLGAIYEADKQQQKILQLQSEKEKETISAKQQSLLNKIFIALLFIVGLLAFLFYRNFKNREILNRQQRELQAQKIKELEKDKQLLTIDAMLRGQEEERKRIAKDLHDGLGGMLSGVKLSFMNVRDNMVLTPENQAGFERTIVMLDNTVGELRKVAHNLMPEILLRFGLEEALNDYCDSIEATTGIKVIYQQVGDNRQLGNAAEAAIYRIVQELMNNVLKHAAATQIVVQVTKHSEKVTVTVEDNGKGFDPALVAGKKGAGLLSIQHRVNYFKGTLDLNSSPGNGSSVTIELMA